MIVKHCAPTRYDDEPRGTIVKVVHDGQEDFYIQVGIITTEWVTWGDFLAKAMKHKLRDDISITMLLDEYTNQSNDL